MECEKERGAELAGLAAIELFNWPQEAHVPVSPAVCLGAATVKSFAAPAILKLYPSQGGNQ